MKKAGFFKRLAACTLVLLLAVPFSAMPQQTENTMAAEIPEQVFRPEELDQMLAPIALYPDALLAQILTAATYPVDVVSADRFAKEHPGLKGQELVDLAKDKEWEPSVKAMLQFPDVLAMMDNQLDWTTKLGDAFLAQQRDVMDSIQRLRQKAYEQGKLTTTREQAVTADSQAQTIIIEPADPEIVYVPVYDPALVYGAWWYPAYPPYYCYYPGYVSGFFLGPFFVNINYGWRSWGCNWFRHNVFININNFNVFVSHRFVRHERFFIKNKSGSIPWKHNVHFRRGRGFRDHSTARQFGGQVVSGQAVRSESTSGFRGREELRTTTSSRTAGTRRREGIRLEGQRIESRGSIPSRFSTRSRVTAMPAVREGSRGRGNVSAFSGAGSGGVERASSLRGDSSSRNSRASGGSSGISSGRQGKARGGGKDDRGDRRR